MRPGWKVRERWQCGFTLIELIVVVCLIAVFLSIALDRLRRYQESAEKSVVELTIASMQSGLQLRLAALLIKGDDKAIRSLDNANPVQFLADVPAGYKGEITGSDGSLSGRSWYFDASRRELVYVPDLTAHLVINGAPQEPTALPRLRFRTWVEFGNPPPGSSNSLDGLDLKGARIVTVVPYSWFKSE